MKSESNSVTEQGNAPVIARGLTPMMAQYARMKAKLPDALLVIRLGDFYEFFFDDAKTVARVLKITLTQRREVPMAGVPYHAAAKYFSQLILAGYRVAIIENLGSETPVYYQP